MEAPKKVPEQQTQVSANDVYEAYDTMVKDTYQSAAKYDMKKANAIVDDMTSGKISPADAQKQLDGVMTTSAATKLENSVKDVRNTVSEGEKQEVYSIFDEMVKDTYQSAAKYDMKKANAIVDDMTSGKITPTLAKQQLLGL